MKCSKHDEDGSSHRVILEGGGGRFLYYFRHVFDGVKQTQKLIE